MKKVMPFVQAMKEKVQQLGITALKQNLAFDEYNVLNINLSYLKNTLEVNYFIPPYFLIVTIFCLG